MEREFVLAWVLGLYSEPVLEEPGDDYAGLLESSESEELISFVRLAVQELRRRRVAEDRISQSVRREIAAHRIRVSRDLRVYVDSRELNMRPMAKSVFLLFLKHPEGIVLKDLWDYREELSGLYSRVSRSDDKGVIGKRIENLLDLCSNELNVNISRVNAAISAMVDDWERDSYTIAGRPGTPKTIPLDREFVVWE